jgi:hypothetical protein
MVFPMMGDPPERHVQSLKWRQTMFENTASEFDNRPLSSGPLFQWLGVHWQGSNYAVSLNSISAVFQTSPSLVANSDNTHLDVAVHDGAVVFMKPFSECFATAPSFLASNELPQWAIVLQAALPAPLGCRVQSVVGPFWAKSGLASLEHDGQNWTVVHRSGASHA